MSSARDYKRSRSEGGKARGSKGTRPAPRRPVARWYLAGVATGVVAAVLVQNIDLLVPALRPGPEASAPASAREAAEPARERPRFEFYSMLPEMEVAVSDEELDRADTPVESDETARAQRAADATYVLQAGSFRVLDEADRLKASLAFLGFEPEIQTVSIDGRDTWHRVRIGPFTDLASLNRARGRLRENDVETMVLRVRP